MKLVRYGLSFITLAIGTLGIFDFVSNDIAIPLMIFFLELTLIIYILELFKANLIKDAYFIILLAIFIFILAIYYLVYMLS